MKYIILTGAVAMLCVGIGRIRAESITNLNQNTEDLSSSEVKKKLNELEKQADMYRQVIEIKQKQEQTLSNQIDLVDAEIKKLEAEVEIKKEEIQDVNNQIIRLESEIKGKEISMDNQKKILSQVLESYYEDKRQDVLLLILDDKLSTFMTKKDRLLQTKDKMEEILNNIKSLKDSLEEEKTTLEQKKAEIIEASSNLEEKITALGNTKEQKELLIIQTQGEESKYQEMLEKIESQKQELLDIDQLSTEKGLSAADYPKPPSSSFASTDWYYSQRDSRWGNENIGNSRTLMKSYGCAVTSAAMISTYYGDRITPGALANKPIFSWDLINWDMSSWKGSKIKVNPNYGHSHGNINWKVIDSEIKDRNPAIVYIKKTNGGGGHYVVIHHKASNGKYVVHDPYFGANIYLDTSRSLVGKMGSDSGTKMDQMIIYRKK